MNAPLIQPSWDPIWDQIFGRQEWGKYPSEYVIRFVAQRWYGRADRSTVRLLDLGSGPGACTWYMAREGFNVSAIDGSRTGIERLRARLAAEKLAAEARVGDFVRLPWPGSSFDGVIDNVSLCANPYSACQAAVAEVHRVLKPGGWFLSASFTPQTWGYGKGTELEPNTFVDITEGPLTGRGRALFMDRSQLEALFRPFGDVAIDTLTWTMERMKHIIELWIVAARKEA